MNNSSGRIYWGWGGEHKGKGLVAVDNSVVIVGVGNTEDKWEWGKNTIKINF